MIPSDTDQLPSHQQSIPFATHMGPFSQAAIGHVDLTNTHSMRCWNSPDIGTLRPMTGVSEEGASPLHLFHGQHVHGNVRCAGAVAHHGFPSGRQQVPESSVQIPRTVPSMLHQWDEFDTHARGGIDAVSAPGRMRLNAALHDSACANTVVRDEDKLTENGNAAHECTVRGGRALQYHVVVDQHGPIPSSVLVHANEAGISDAQCYGTSQTPTYSF